MSARHFRNDEEFAKRVQTLLDEEMKHPEEWIGLSFARPGKFLGFTIVRAHGMVTGVRRARELGINPGGEVRSYTFDRISKPPAEIYEKLVTNKDEIDRIIQLWGD